jgi:hypothetical protein
MATKMRTCPYCSENLADEATSCPRCGRDLTDAPTVVLTHSGVRFGIGFTTARDAYGVWRLHRGKGKSFPSGEPTIGPFPYTPEGWQDAWQEYAALEPQAAMAATGRAPVERRSSGIGVAAIVSGIVGLFIIPILLGPVAIILGVVAIAQKDGLGWAGLLIGALDTIVVAILVNDALQNLNV